MLFERDTRACHRCRLLYDKLEKMACIGSIETVTVIHSIQDVFGPEGWCCFSRRFLPHESKSFRGSLVGYCHLPSELEMDNHDVKSLIIGAFYRAQGTADQVLSNVHHPGDGSPLSSSKMQGLPMKATTLKLWTMTGVQA